MTRVWNFTMRGLFSCGQGSDGRLLRPPALLKRPLHEASEPSLEHLAAAGLGAASKRNPIKTQGLQGVNGGLEAGGGALPKEHPGLTRGDRFGAAALGEDHGRASAGHRL